MKNPPKSGIYEISCTVNRYFYVGSAVNLRRRKNGHWRSLTNKTHYNRFLQSTWNSHGSESFRFRVLEYVADTKNLIQREQYYLTLFSKSSRRRCMNLTPIAGSVLGVKYSAEQCEKMRQARLGKRMSPETCQKMRQAKLGGKHSPETREKIRAANLGKKHSLETREKIRAAHLGKKLSPEAVAASLGRKPNFETRMKMSKSQKLRFQRKREARKEKSP